MFPVTSCTLSIGENSIAFASCHQNFVQVSLDQLLLWAYSFVSQVSLLLHPLSLSLPVFPIGRFFLGPNLTFSSNDTLIFVMFSKYNFSLFTFSYIYRYY